MANIRLWLQPLSLIDWLPGFSSYDGHDFTFHRFQDRCLRPIPQACEIQGPLEGWFQRAGAEGA